MGVDVPPGTTEEILSRRKLTVRSTDHGWLPNGNLWFGFELTRIVLTSASDVSFPSFPIWSKAIGLFVWRMVRLPAM